MNVASLPHVVTIINPAAAAANRYNDVTPDYGDEAERLENVPAWVQRQTTAEAYQSGRDASVAAWLLVLPTVWIIPGVDAPATIGTVTVNARSRIEYDGDTYEVDGEPNLTSSTRGPHHWEVTLKSVAG